MTRKRVNRVAIDGSERPFTVELCCGGDDCRRVWATWRCTSTGGGADRGDRLGVRVTNVVPGARGLKLYECGGCGYKREVVPADLGKVTQAAAALGRRRLFAGRDF